MMVLLLASDRIVIHFPPYAESRKGVANKGQSRIYQGLYLEQYRRRNETSVDGGAL